VNSVLTQRKISWGSLKHAVSHQQKAITEKMLGAPTIILKAP